MQDLRDSPVAAEFDRPHKHRFSQTPLPVMTPPASRIRVVIVASVLGTQSLIMSVPKRQGTPFTAIVSCDISMADSALTFRQIVLPASRP
jgi:hypothetical protein